MNERRLNWRVILALATSVWVFPAWSDDAVSEPDAGTRADGRPDWRKPGVALNRAPVLGTIGSQSLNVGKPWRLHLRGRDPDGLPPQLTITPLPDRASISVRPDGWYVLAWTPRHDDVGQLEMRVTATDAADELLRTERVVTLLIAPAPTLVEEGDEAAFADADPELGPEPPLESASGDETAAELVPPEDPVALLELEEEYALPPEPEDVRPTIAPPAAQIVSAGRTVSYRVKATLEDGRVPLMGIDRLPLNASFDANPDGSHTFFWPTGNADQGEHRFRVTAYDPWDDENGTSADLLVVVGDPTRSKTEPGDVIAPATLEESPNTGSGDLETTGSQEGSGVEDADFADPEEFPLEDYPPEEFPPEAFDPDSFGENFVEQDNGQGNGLSAFDDSGTGDGEARYFEDPVESDPFYPTDDGYEDQMNEFDENYEDEYGDLFEDEFPDDGLDRGGYFEPGYEEEVPREFFDENYGADPEYILE